jgi:hypothetical protein
MLLAYGLGACLMDVQWVIIADSANLNGNGTIDIIRIKHCLSIWENHHALPVFLIAKPHFSPLEVGQNKVITLKVVSDRNEEIFVEDVSYKVPNLGIWADKITYIKFQPIVTFHYAGDYDFKLFVDREYKNSESIEIIALPEVRYEKR